ncbi:MAG TPA: SH3 domain-containing protein [Candidatus Nitrosotenuis sp.]|jgi:SH3-like domain-containing protein|nr:SH3 domain-containing protein [Candidatus Nitrosotenuis sp.]
MMTIRWWTIVSVILATSGEAAVEKLPLPRFASLRSNKVNSHVGPGNNYPIEWTFVRQWMPVEIIAEFDTWRQIRDCQGTQVWVHKSLLSGRRHVVIQEKRRKLLKKPQKDASVVAYLEPGVIGKLTECQKNWCYIQVNGYSGWMPRKFMWGVYPHEAKFK